MNLYPAELVKMLIIDKFSKKPVDFACFPRLDVREMTLLTHAESKAGDNRTFFNIKISNNTDSELYLLFQNKSEPLYLGYRFCHEKEFTFENDVYVFELINEILYPHTSKPTYQFCLINDDRDSVFKYEQNGIYCWDKVYKRIVLINKQMFKNDCEKETHRFDPFIENFVPAKATVNV